jgi:NAD(P)-dependent dehydrogenase (short-subunit alcohol dehydrogenase family)
MARLSGRTILVTGASGGIGAVIAARLAEAGAHVIAHHRDAADRAGAEAALAAAPPGQGMLLAGDLATLPATRALWEAALAWRGRIDVLVLNAGLFLDGGIEDDDAAWDHAWAAQAAVNARAPAALMRRAVAHWQGSGGILITLSSWVAERGASSPRHIAYAATKAAVRAAAQGIATAHAADGVLSYVVAPGVVRAGMSQRAAGGDAATEAAITAGLAMREWVPPGEIAELVAFLATGSARHLSGATLDINGATYLR